MLDRWKAALEPSWFHGSNVVPKVLADGYWRVKNGVNRRLNQVKP
jgi:hypothetical protein